MGVILVFLSAKMHGLFAWPFRAAPTDNEMVITVPFTDNQTVITDMRYRHARELNQNKLKNLRHALQTRARITNREPTNLNTTTLMEKH
jgi:hypothetical protein